MNGATCPHCCAFPRWIGSLHPAVHRVGVFRRKFDGRLIQRYLCRRCGRSFSESSSSPTYRQHKPYLNNPIAWDLVCGVSQRRIALRRRISRKTVAAKLAFSAIQARKSHEEFLKGIRGLDHVQFDDMETWVHSKLKPLSIPIVVASRSRIILAYDVAVMPCKGVLAKASRRKYGPRPDERPQAWQNVLTAVRPLIAPNAVILSDSNPHYPAMIERHLPEAQREQTMSRRACVVGLGELKEGSRDPLFSLNHTAAMIRANINRLFRRTWCTTKRTDRLRDHLSLYVVFHNRFLLDHPSKSY